MTTQIQEYSKTEAALAELRSRYANAAFDVDSADGMKAAKEARAEVRGYRTALEKMRKDIKGPALERCRLIDDEAKRITAELVAIEEPIDAQIKAVEARKEAEKQAKIDAELRRVQDIQDRIAEIRGAVPAVNSMAAPSSTLIAEHISDVTAIVIDATFAEFRDTAADAKIAALSTLKELHTAALAREAEQERIRQERAELEKLRAEQAKRDAAAAAERAAKEKAEREAREAEQRAERERLDAERKAQEGERRRLAAEAAQLEADRKALAAQQERERKAKEDAEREAARLKANAEAAARKAKFPGIPAIVAALAEHFDVQIEVAEKWVNELRKQEAA
jgi:hypothetical protein